MGENGTELCSGPRELLDGLRELPGLGGPPDRAPPGEAGRAAVAIVVAHPDDECIGAGSLLPHLRRGWIVQVTDGAPRDLVDARAHGFSSRGAYAAARRDEALAALGRAGVPRGRRFEMARVDQEAALDLAGLTRDLLETFRRLRPAAVLTHAYEGGHPDHDAVAFAAHTAAQSLERGGEPAPLLIEMAFYHDDGRGGIARGTFLPGGAGGPGLLRRLSPEERRRKTDLLACFATQRAFLRGFPLEERYRLAPSYDFARPPHPGTLLYERSPWGMDGSRFRALATRAVRELRRAGGRS